MLNLQEAEYHRTLQQKSAELLDSAWSPSDNAGSSMDDDDINSPGQRDHLNKGRSGVKQPSERRGAKFSRRQTSGSARHAKDSELFDLTQRSEQRLHVLRLYRDYLTTKG